METVIDRTTGEAPQPQSGLYQHAIKFGAIIGGVGILLTILLYVIDATVMVSLKYLFAILIVNIGLLVYAGLNYRKQIGGYMNFGTAFIYSFVVLAVSGLVGFLFGLILYHVIDPELPQVLSDTVVANTEEMMAKFGAPQEQIDTKIDEMRADIPKQFTLGGQVLGFGKGLIFSAIFSLIIALIIRKNPPIDSF